MTATHPEQDIQQYPAHFEPPHGSTWKLFFGPGLVRGAWMAGLGFVLGMLLVLLLRAWWGWDPLWNTEVILVVGAMVAAPIGFLAGIGVLRLLVPLRRRRRRRGPRTTRATARTRGRTTSASTPTTR